MEKSGHTEISHRVLQTCAAIFRYAIVMEKAVYNPAASLQRGALTPHKATHYPTITAREMPNFLKQLNDADTTPINKLAVRLLMHTFVRTGEIPKLNISTLRERNVIPILQSGYVPCTSEIKSPPVKPKACGWVAPCRWDIP